MSKNYFRVLSIDFDFFPKVNKTQLSEYPKGIDLPTELSEIGWSTRNERMENIQIHKTFYKEIIRILKRQKKEIPVLFSNSHLNTYYFILKHYNNKKIELVNIDLHHDIVNDNKKTDCGNWIGHLCDFSEEHQGINVLWIARKLSKKIYGISDEEAENFNMQFDFSPIRNIQFDAVSVARSDNWVPPHLDPYFDNLLKICENHFTDITAEACIMQPRKILTIKDIMKN